MWVYVRAWAWLCAHVAGGRACSGTLVRVRPGALHRMRWLSIGKTRRIVPGCNRCDRMCVINRMVQRSMRPVVSLAQRAWCSAETALEHGKTSSACMDSLPPRKRSLDPARGLAGHSHMVESWSTLWDGTNSAVTNLRMIRIHNALSHAGGVIGIVYRPGGGDRYDALMGCKWGQIKSRIPYPI